MAGLVNIIYKNPERAWDTIGSLNGLVRLQASMGVVRK